ncbi:hypothetical protein [Chitinophaga barathri]|uniref:Uncharacterized protein n=1 Tax=Chitinophaga barathri TaxID=1647451 RepID=A0A3N4MLB9_9BACT|nr:hypothetical protein [Chitinophaga barathri]RPD40379.1 hypothetical protein EG028_13800 [Chitinophaga barathri]
MIQTTPPPDRLAREFPGATPLSYYLHKTIAWDCGERVIYRPGWLRTFYATAIGIVLCIALPAFVWLSDGNFGGTVITLVLMLPVAGLLIWRQLFNKDINYTLQIDGDGIRSGEWFLPWKDLEDVGFWESRRVSGTGLVLIPYNSKAEVFSLALFTMEKRELAWVISYFRLRSLNTAAPLAEETFPA